MISEAVVIWPVAAEASGDAAGARSGGEDDRERIGKRAAEAGKLGQELAADIFQRRRADHRDDAGEADQHAGDAGGRHPLARQ
jgi:hypothetical protein